MTKSCITLATIQVLLTVGLDRLTTTRVAERAGVSVGTLYQYYPDKQALLYAVLEVHGTKVAEAVESACHACRGATIKVLVAAVVEAFVNAKLERTDISTALYAAAAEPEGAAVVRRVSKRGQRALTAALAETAGATVGDMEFVALMLYSAMAGPARCWRLVRRRRWWFGCARNCWCFARGTRRSRCGQTEDFFHGLEKSSAVSHDAVNHDHRNAEQPRR